MKKSSEHASNDHAIRGFRWVATGRIVTQVITWSMTIITVRFLHPEDYGVIATAGLFTALAMLLLDGGLGIVLVTQQNISTRAQGAVISATLIGASLLGVMIAILAPLGSWFFRSPELTAVLLVSAIYMPLAALAVVPAALLSKSMQFHHIAIAQTLASLLQGITSLGLAIAGVGYWALIVGNFAGTILRVLLLWRALETKVSPNLELGLVRPLVRSSSHVVGSRLIYFFSNDFDTFLVSRIGGIAMVGPYSLAKSLCHSVLDQLSAIVNQVLVPVFASKTDHADQQNGVRQVVTITSTLMFPLFWMMGVVSREILPLVFGSRWSGLILPFVAFSLMLPLRSVFAFLDTAVLGTGRSATTLRNMVVWASIMMPLLLVGALLDIRYVAVMWVIGFPLVFLFGMRQMAATLSVGMRSLLKPMLAPMASAATACLAMLGFDFTVELTPILMLACELAIGAVVYGLLMWRFAPAHYNLILSIVLRFLGRSPA